MGDVVGVNCEDIVVDFVNGVEEGGFGLIGGDYVCLFDVVVVVLI